MPRRARELSAVQIRRLRLPGMHAVGGVSGLYLQITESGARTWILRAKVGDKRRHIGLGGYPTVTVAQARRRAREYRETIWDGRDPVAERQAAKHAVAAKQRTVLTFDEAAQHYLDAKSREFKSAKHKAQWQNTLRNYANPVIGNLRVDQIELSHILQILEPIWESKTETATRLRARIEKVLAWATVRDYRTGDNPARWQGHLDAVLPKPSKLKGDNRHKALPYAELPTFMECLRQRNGTATRALEFLILTATRPGEVRNAKWDEIDLDKGVWTIPANRTDKTKKEHRVPLTDSALRLLRDLPRFGETDIVFPSNRSGSLSDMALTNVLRRMEVDGTVQGFRSTFRDWAADHTNHPNEVIEKALARATPDKVEPGHRGGDLLRHRKRLMQEWAAFCDGRGETDAATS